MSTTSVRGHGEKVFASLLDQIAEGKEPAPEAGLALRTDGEPVQHGVSPIPHPKDLPRWNLDRVPTERYLRKTFLGRKTIGYNSSYGCPFLCNFCAVVNLVNGGWLPQTAEQVATAVEVYHQRWGADAVEMNDNNFFVHEARVKEFAERISPLEIAWWGEGRIDTLLNWAPDTWQLMSDTGLRMIFLGAESGSDETLERMNKGGRLTTRHTLEMVRMMKSYGVVPELSFVLGCPPDPEADVAKTLDFIREVKRHNEATEIILYFYSPEPLEGDLFHDATAGGFRFPETLDDWVAGDWLDFAQRRSGTLPWIGRSLRHRVKDFERVLHAYYPTSTLPHLTGVRRQALRLASAWRYHTKLYTGSLELGAMQRLVRYRRPETSGF